MLVLYVIKSSDNFSTRRYEEASLVLIYVRSSGEKRGKYHRARIRVFGLS